MQNAAVLTMVEKVLKEKPKVKERAGPKADQKEDATSVVVRTTKAIARKLNKEKGRHPCKHGAVGGQALTQDPLPSSGASSIPARAARDGTEERVKEKARVSSVKSQIRARTGGSQDQCNTNPKAGGERETCPAYLL